MAWGDDFGNFEVDIEAAAEREAEAERDEAEALDAAFGGIGSGRIGPGFSNGFIDRSTTAQGGIGSGNRFDRAGGQQGLLDIGSNGVMSMILLRILLVILV